MQDKKKVLPSQESSFVKKISFEEGFFNSCGTYVHPSSIIGSKVKLGKNVKIGPFCSVLGNTTIGSETRIHGHASIGMPAQDTHTKQSLGSIEIGQNCEIREFVTIGASKNPEGKTFIGNHCYIMNFCHIAHDVTIENNVSLINNVNLAGHVYIEQNVMLMANTALHQFCKVGAYSALAPFSGMRQDLPPFSLFNGRPGRFAGLNLIALKRVNFSPEDIYAIKKITKYFFQDKLPLETIEQLLREQSSNDKKSLLENIQIQKFITFIKNSTRGITRKTINDDERMLL